MTGDLSTAPSATAFVYTAFKRWNVFLRGVAPPKLSRLDSHRFMSSVVIFVRGISRRMRGTDAQGIPDAFFCFLRLVRLRRKNS